MIFHDIFGKLHKLQHKATKKQIVRPWLNEKMLRKPDKINKLIMKTKADLKE